MDDGQTPTYADALAALQAFREPDNGDGGRAVLDEFGVRILPDLDQAKYPAFLARLTELTVDAVEARKSIKNWRRRQADRGLG